MAGYAASEFLGNENNRNMKTVDSLLYGKCENIDLIKQVFKCNPEKGYFEHAQKWSTSLSRNFRLWNVCQSLLRQNKACFIPQLYYSMCLVFPIRLVKTIRFPFEEVENLFVDSEIGSSLRVIFLFRDPRGIFQSVI